MDKQKPKGVRGGPVFQKARFNKEMQKETEKNYNVDYLQAIGMGFFFPETFHMFGLPERKF